MVFGRERKARPARQALNQTSSKPNQPGQNQNRFKSKIEVTEELLEAELDQDKRPKFKAGAAAHRQLRADSGDTHSVCFIHL